MSELLKTKFTVQGAEGVVISGTKLCTCISTPFSLTIPRGITALGKGCFSGQDNLRRIIIPSSVIIVEQNCFANCPNLKLIRVPESLKDFENVLKYGNSARVEYVSDSRKE